MKLVTVLNYTRAMMQIPKGQRAVTRCGWEKLGRVRCGREKEKLVLLLRRGF